MVRHHDQDERETGGARYWDGVFSVLKGKFGSQLEKEFTDEDSLQSKQGSKSVKMKMVDHYDMFVRSKATQVE